MRQEDIDFDKLFDEELPFKPLTKGLGFHHSPKEEGDLHGSLQMRQKELGRSLEERAAVLAKTQKTQETSIPSTQNGAMDGHKDMGDLAPFYNSPVSSAEVELNILDEAQPQATSLMKSEEANMALRFIAFNVDLAIIISVLAVTFLSTIISSGISLMVIRDNLSAQFLMTYILPISMLFYFFYFSFFDKTAFSTPGKKLMGLRVCSHDESKRVKMSQAFLRSIIVALSVLSAGALGLLDFQGKLTETRVVKK